MALPIITVQAAFGSQPGASSYTWTTISVTGGAPSYVRSLSYSRGRNNELDQMSTGTGTVLLGDPKSVFDPRNTASLYYPNVLPVTPIRATAKVNGNSYSLFQHFVQRWPRTSRIGNSWTERSLTTFDGFDLLNRASLAGQSYAQELNSVRVSHVLDTAGWSASARNILTGDSTAAAVVFAADDTTRALDHLLLAASSEQGLFFIDGAGVATFVNRHALLLAPYLTSQATFSDQPGGFVTYTGMVDSYDIDHIWNEFRGSRPGSSTVVAASNAASILQYSRRTKDFSTLLLTDNELLSQAQWLVSRQKDPLNRLDTLTVRPGTNTAAWDTLLGLELGERITVLETPPGFTGQVSHDYNIQTLNVQLPTDLADASFTLGLWPADINQYWRAGVVGASEAGTTTKAAY